MSPEIQKLLHIIERKLDWGGGDQWQSRDFENLNQLILDETGVSLSASTLRRIWGHVAYKHLPSTTTLDALAKFAGFETWRKFTKQLGTPAPAVELIEKAPAATIKNRKSLSKISWVIGIVIVASLISIFAVKKSKPPIKPEQYSFSYERVSRKIPNSVIFTYDATASPTDSVYIQQSWDPMRRHRVDKSLHKHTEIYYDPGFHRAKLIVGDKIVQEQKILIPTEGWLGMIRHEPVPVYLEPNEFVDKNVLELPVSEIAKKNIALDPQPPVIVFSNVGNFDPVPVSDFSFSADIKNEYSKGANACQFSYVFIVTDNNPIVIPLSIKGCVSELNLMAVDSSVSGKKADLSAFGVDFSDWIHVACKTNAGKLQYFVNDKLAFEIPAPKINASIVGMSYFFMGTGAVKNIRLLTKDKTVFSAF